MPMHQQNGEKTDFESHVLAQWKVSIKYKMMMLSFTWPIKAVLLHILIKGKENQEVTICMACIRKTETKSFLEKYLTFVVKIHLERMGCLRWCCPS